MPYAAEVFYLACHGESPIVVATPQDVDAFIDDLLAQPASNRFATLYIKERHTNARGFPDHELAVGVDPDTNLGALTYLGPQGFWVSRGEAGDDDGVTYYYMGNDRELPPHSEVPLDIVRQATKEFLTTGGERPIAADWQDRGVAETSHLADGRA